MDGLTTKICTKCKEVKPLDEFGKSSSTKDGKQYLCKPCHVKNVAASKAKRPWVNAENRRKHREKELEKNRLYKAARRKQMVEYTSEWRKNNPEKTKTQRANYKAKRRSAKGKLSSGISEKLYTLQRGKCACCGHELGKDFHIDHIVPLALGGENVDSNVQLLKAECNLRKGAKDPVEYMQTRGFLI